MPNRFVLILVLRCEVCVLWYCIKTNRGMKRQYACYVEIYCMCIATCEMYIPCNLLSDILFFLQGKGRERKKVMSQRKIEGLIVCFIQWNLALLPLISMITSFNITATLSWLELISSCSHFLWQKSRKIRARFWAFGGPINEFPLYGEKDWLTFI